MGSYGDEDGLAVISRPNDEASGQTLRMAVALSAITSRPIKIENIRASKKNPGMTPSLIAIVAWLGEITKAEIEGNEPQSQTLTFRPKHRPSSKLVKKVIKVDSGSMAASSVLFLQTMIPVLLLIGGDIKSNVVELRIDGATNCRGAPSYEYLTQVFFPALEAYFGIKIISELTRRGWGQLTPDPRVIRKGTIRVKFMPLEWGTTIKLRNDVKLCDEYEEGIVKTTGGTEASYTLGSRSVDNNILNVVATIITPAAMHESLQEALTEDIENRFPGAEIEFRTEESGQVERVYVMLVAEAKDHRWSRDYINSDRLKDVNIVSLSKQISSQLTKDLEDESNGDCPIDQFLQDQLVIYQCLAEGRSSFPRPRKDQSVEFALRNLHPDFPLTKDSLNNLTLLNDRTADSRHTQMARFAAATVLPDARFYNDGKVCIGAGVKAGVAPTVGRNKK